METERTIRRLAAVLFADVVGYSRLMAEDEVRALAGLNRLRETAFNPAVARHNGRIVKLMGDGTLVEFGSVFDAVDCAIAIQTAIASSDGQPAMPLRIGVNLGDIIIQGDDIYGDGVNIAARLETQARPGGVCISSVVNESVRSRSGSMFVDGGEVTVKNIARPIHVWHWHPADTATSGSTVESNAAPPQPEREPETASIAVLAFDNMSGDADQEYFSDGISEDIITDLSKVPGLMVIARNSSFAYKGKAVDIRTVGQELGVGHVLEGSVRRAGDRVRVTAQLIDAVTGGHVWAERFDRDLEDIFAVQDEVALKIVDALKIRLSPGEEANIASIGTTNMAAHDSFLRMRDLVLDPREMEASHGVWRAGYRARPDLCPGARVVFHLPLARFSQWLVRRFSGDRGSQGWHVRGEGHGSRSERSARQQCCRGRGPLGRRLRSGYRGKRAGQFGYAQCATSLVYQSRYCDRRRSSPGRGPRSRTRYPS
jgi:adenylate cyclase